MESNTVLPNVALRHQIDGPGEDAFKVYSAKDDDDMWLVSPGVIDCIVLTVSAPHNPPDDGRVVRAMAHYNKFSGPTKEGIEKMFKEVKAASSKPEMWTVSFNRNEGSNLDFTEALTALVGDAAAPSKPIIDHRKFKSGDKREITVFLAPDGKVTAEGSGKKPVAAAGGRGNFLGVGRRGKQNESPVESSDK